MQLPSFDAEEGEIKQGFNHTLKTASGTIVSYFQIYESVALGLWVWISSLEISLGVFYVSANICTFQLVQLQTLICQKYIKV